MKKPSLKRLKQKCWDALSLKIRKGAADHRGFAVCYTCGKLDQWKNLQAGHAIPGRHNAVLFDEDIIRPQCESCNVFRRGMYHIFTAKLIKENGMKWWEDKLIASHATVKFTRDDYIRMIKEFT